MCHANGVDHVNLEGNKQIWERGCLIRSLLRKRNNAIKKTTDQHTFKITN